ncbi:nucleotidyltransferase family protein [Candidatus Parcubacteria bacterium]|nr:nucleotidyltransferase family protein [Candidatus Parcubacteria bacterium]
MVKNNLSNYKAIILAGGKGTRLYPVTKEIPKPLLPIRKKPIINYLVDLFREQGVKEIAVLINKEFREDFDWWKRRYYPKNKIKIFEEEKPLGTFGGVFLLKDWLSSSSFFLTNGDELKEIDLNKMASFHQSNQEPATIALVKVPHPQDYGVVVCEKEKVKEFLEKPSPSQILKKFGWAGNPPTNYINSGLYLLSPEIFNYLPRYRVKAGYTVPKFTMIETDIFPKLVQEKKLNALKFQGRWTDCGTWERYSGALRKWRV